ncbi:Cyclin-T1-3 [Dactylella cylindrospora]|nr:Cyclin-T1-3 [Dactylella cylindrospora]
MRHTLAPPSQPDTEDFMMEEGDHYDQWLFTDEELMRTPSVKSGFSVQQEREGRSKGCNFILQVGIKLKLPQLTLATASVFLHRFFMRESLKDFHYYNVAATALYLATKVEENCRKLSDLIQAVARTAQKNDNIIIDEQCKEYWKWHDTIMFTEEHMLAALCYDFNIEKPYKLLQDYLQLLSVVDDGGRKEKDIMKAAWAFINDSHLTVLCLMFPASTIAGAALYMSAKFNDTSFRDKDGKPWWKVIGVDLLDIKKACNQMADLYECVKNPSSVTKSWEAYLLTGENRNNPLKNADGKYPMTPETEDTNSNRTRHSMPSTRLTFEDHEGAGLNSNGTSVQDVTGSDAKLPDTSHNAAVDEREEGEFDDDDDREEGEL